MAALLLLAAEARAASGGVSISGFSFSPTEIDVEAGDTVTWTNADPVGHTVTADGGAFGSGTLVGGDTFSWTVPAAPGSYPYHCAIHPSMTGTVVVTAAATPAPTAGPTAAPTVPPTDASLPGGDDAAGTVGTPVALGALGGLLLGLGRLGTRRRRGRRPGSGTGR